MNLSLAANASPRHLRWMPKASENDRELGLLGLALQMLRKEAGLSQEQASERVEPQLTKQAWGRYEGGEVKGLLTPDVQQRMAAALGHTRDELLLVKERLALQGESYRPSFRPATGLRDRSRPWSGGGDQRQAIFPTRDGEVVLTYPAELGEEGLAELSNYLRVFLTSRGVTLN